MHNPDYVPATANASSAAGGVPGHLPGASSLPPYAFKPLEVRFSTKQAIPPEQRKLGEIFAQKVAAKEFFYGIEMSARSYGQQQTLLDYDTFGLLMPLFTSLVWLGPDYAGVANVTEVDSVRLAREMQPHVIVMPHFTCYRADSERLCQFLSQNFSNVLALRGDQVSPEQQFAHAKDLVAHIRSVRGDTISIGVAGYPEGHPDAKTIEQDMCYLKEKVDAGADFIITQLCFSPETIVNFIRLCRDNHIDIPIVVGVIVPENMRILQRIMEITRVRMPDEEYGKFKQLADKPQEFQDYAVTRALDAVRAVLDSNLNVYGFQFYTMNRLKNVQRVLMELQEEQLSKNSIETK